MQHQHRLFHKLSSYLIQVQFIAIYHVFVLPCIMLGLAFARHRCRCLLLALSTNAPDAVRVCTNSVTCVVARNVMIDSCNNQCSRLVFPGFARRKVRIWM